MKVTNITSSKGNKVANQFIINNIGRQEFVLEDGSALSAVVIDAFQSYESLIVVRIVSYGSTPKALLDKNRWDCSRTTSKYRNMFLGETKKETEAKIKSGEYVLCNLN